MQNNKLGGDLYASFLNQAYAISKTLIWTFFKGAQKKIIVPVLYILVFFGNREEGLPKAKLEHMGFEEPPFYIISCFKKTGKMVTLQERNLKKT